MTDSGIPYRYNGQGQLVCENVVLEEVAARFGTPLYVYSKESIVRRCREAEKAFRGRPHRTYFAVKANANRHLMSLVASEGLGADVNSVGELTLALQAGFAPGDVTFSGVGKRDDEIAAAVRIGLSAINVESEEELLAVDRIAGQQGRRADVCIRVNLDVPAGAYEYVTTATRENKFGVGRRTALRMVADSTRLPNVRIRGFHSHIGSQILELGPFRGAAEALAAFVREAGAIGVWAEEIDFGGGFGVQYRGFLRHPELPAEDEERPEFTLESLLDTVDPILRSTGAVISIQPGRFIVGQSGSLLTRVLYRKSDEGKTFIITDGGMNDLLRPTLYRAHHQIVPARLSGAPFETVDVVGPLCESGDFFARDRMLPTSRRGDLLAVLCTGAYGFVLASNYNARPRPAEVLVDQDSAVCIREREALDALNSGSD